MISGRTTTLAAVLAMLALTGSSARAETLTICTVVADTATGHMLKQEGDCDTPATAASTFKIAISLMGFDAGFLKDAHTPALPYVEGYPDWNPLRVQSSRHTAGTAGFGRRHHATQPVVA